jgi:tetratricopeptide (TPR) repeat protein
MDLEEAAGAYEGALNGLPQANDADAKDKILTLLLARDGVDSALNNGSNPACATLHKISDLDEKLKQSATNIDAIAGRLTLACWRDSIHPSQTQWWWQLDQRAAACEPQSNPLWTIPAAVLFALSLSVLADTITTLRTGGINGLTVFGTLLQSLLALLAGSAFLSGGREWLEKFFGQLGVNRKFRGASRVWLAVGVLLLTLGLRLLLPNVVARYRNREGDAAFSQRQFPQAVVNYQQAVALNPSFVKAHFNLAVAYDKVHDNLKAIDEYQHSIDSDPNNYVAYNNLARLLILQQKDFRGALRRLDFLRQNLQKVPADIQYYLFKNRGWANLELKNFDAAKDDLMWALVKRDGAGAHYLLGKVYEAQNDKDNAGKEWEKCIEILQSNPDAEEELEPDWIAYAQEQLRQMKKGTQP